MRSWASATTLAGIVMLSATSSSAAPEDPGSLLTDYQALLEWQFSTTPSPLPATGIRWQLDTATWELGQGEIWTQRRTSGGQVTGFVFRGAGRFQISVPDPIELRQLRRFAEDPNLEALGLHFDALVVRVVGLPWIEDLPTGAGKTFAPHPLARDRHDHWLLFRGLDADSRVVAALARQGDLYLRVDMRTLERGWMSYEFDLQRPEEISLEWFNAKFNAGESWLSLDRAEDGTETGQPSGSFLPRVDIDRIGTPPI